MTLPVRSGSIRVGSPASGVFRVGGRQSQPVLSLRCPPQAVPEATQIRSTVLSSSLGAIDALGLRRAYELALPIEHHEVIASLVVGEWLPMHVGVAHYRAIESLGLRSDIARDNGRRVADKVQKTYLATVIKAIGFGIDPWSILPRTQAIVDRLLFGASASVVRVGPKDAKLEIHGAPIAAFEYVRSGWAGMIESGLDLVTRKAYCRDTSPNDTTTVASYLVTWV
jgi:hypothetical protein